MADKLEKLRKLDLFLTGIGSMLFGAGIGFSLGLTRAVGWWVGIVFWATGFVALVTKFSLNFEGRLLAERIRRSRLPEADEDAEL